MGGFQGCSHLMMPVEMLDDVTLLRKQVKFLSRNLMKLTRRYYEQEEIATQMAEELRKVEEERERISLENSRLV